MTSRLRRCRTLFVLRACDSHRHRTRLWRSEALRASRKQSKAALRQRPPWGSKSKPLHKSSETKRIAITPHSPRNPTLGLSSILKTFPLLKGSLGDYVTCPSARKSKPIVFHVLIYYKLRGSLRTEARVCLQQPVRGRRGRSNTDAFAPSERLFVENPPDDSCTIPRADPVDWGVAAALCEGRSCLALGRPQVATTGCRRQPSSSSPSPSSFSVLLFFPPFSLQSPSAQLVSLLGPGVCQSAVY